MSESPRQGASFEARVRIPDMPKFKLQPLGGTPPQTQPPDLTEPVVTVPLVADKSSGIYDRPEISTEARAAFAKADAWAADLRARGQAGPPVAAARPEPEVQSPPPAELEAVETAAAAQAEEDPEAAVMSPAEAEARKRLIEIQQDYESRGRHWARRMEAFGRYMLYAPPMPNAALDIAGVTDRIEPYTSFQYLDYRGPGRERERERGVENGINNRFGIPLYNGIVEYIRNRAEAQGGDTRNYLLAGDDILFKKDSGQKSEVPIRRYIYVQWRDKVADHVKFSEEEDDPTRTIEWQFALPSAEAKQFENDVTPDVMREAFRQTFAPIIWPENGKGGLEIRPATEMTVRNAATYGEPRREPSQREIAIRVDEVAWSQPYIFPLPPQEDAE